MNASLKIDFIGDAERPHVKVTMRGVETNEERIDLLRAGATELAKVAAGINAGEYDETLRVR